MYSDVKIYTCMYAHTYMYYILKKLNSIGSKHECKPEINTKSIWKLSTEFGLLRKYKPIKIMTESEIIKFSNVFQNIINMRFEII